MIPPTRPQPPLVDDGYLVEPEPLDDRIPRHTTLGRLTHRPARDRRPGPGCSILGFLLLAIAMLFASAILDATPRSSAIPTSPQPGASGAIGSVVAPALVPVATSGRPTTGAPLADATAAGAPTPTAEIGTALWTASATWCAPTPTQCRRWGGHALLAALPTYSGVPWKVRVRFGERHIDVTVVSICGCGIDLSPFAFGKLAPLSRGRITVEVEGPIAPLPPTDEEKP